MRGSAPPQVASDPAQERERAAHAVASDEVGVADRILQVIDLCEIAGQGNILVERVRQAHDTHPRPNGRDLLVGTVQNKRDGKDFLSTRLAYRRLDTS